MQELAESGAKVLNAQAVEFAKERGIAIYARATARRRRRDGRAQVPAARARPRGRRRQRDRPRAGEPGASRFGGRAAGASATSAAWRASSCCSATARTAALASLVLSLENVHGFGAFREALARRFDGERHDPRRHRRRLADRRRHQRRASQNWRRAAAIVGGLGCPRWGASTSSFRISFLLPEAHVDAAVRALHDGMVTEGRAEPASAD